MKAVHDNDNHLMNDISSVLNERDVDHLHDHYQIFWEIFQIYALSPNVRVDDQIPTKDTIMVYEEQLKAGLRFSMDPFFVEVFRFHQLSVTQLHPNSWRILMAFRFVCFNNKIEPSFALFSQLYQLGIWKNEEFWFLGEKNA